MAEELRLALILLGSLAIGAVVLHGIWTVRKNVQEQRPASPMTDDEGQQFESEEEQEIQTLKIKQMEMDFNTLTAEDDQAGLPVVDMDVDSIYHKDDQTGEISEATSKHKERPDAQLVEEETDHDDEVLPTFTALDTPIQDEVSQIQTADTFEQEGGNITSQLTVENDFKESDSSQVISDSAEPQPKPQSKPEQPAKPQREPEVLILFVDKPSGEMIDGARLLPLLLTLGFKFGEMDFFHRHEQTSGHGEILFSLANMYNPGTFDIDHMEQVQTRGLSIFMTMPNAGEALQTFNMMHNAAKKIADEFDAQVLDYKREPLDVVRVRHYVEKIRKF